MTDRETRIYISKLRVNRVNAPTEPVLTKDAPRKNRFMSYILMFHFVMYFQSVYSNVIDT